MTKEGWLLGEKPDPLGNRIEEIRDEIKLKNPERLADRTGAIYTPKDNDSGEFSLKYWSEDVILKFPEFSGVYAEGGESLNNFDLTMLAYYFNV